MVADNVVTPEEISNALSEVTADDPSDMVDFIAVTPDERILHNRRGADRPPLAYCIVGYHADTEELGVFHWTSRTDKAYLKRVILNNLRLAKKHNVPLNAKDVHILAVSTVEEVPENAEYFTKGDRSFVAKAVPKMSLQERIAQLKADLENEELNEETRNNIEARLAKLTERLERKTTRELSEDGEELNLEALNAEIQEESSEAPESFRTKKIAVSVAQERGLTADHVLKDEDGRWIIVNR